MATDQAHEQNNSTVKSEGGAIGLTQNLDAPRRWMVAGPEIVRVTAEFEASMERQNKRISHVTKHHEQNKATQETFVRQVSDLCNVLEEFTEMSHDLMRLDTRDIADSSVVEAIYNAEDLGQKQYETFTKDRLIERSTSISEPIKKNKLSLFSRPSPREKSKASVQLPSLKSDCSLFSRLYIACQSRDGNLSEFFQHENQACPPALSFLGKLRQGSKSDLMQCLEKSIEVTCDTPNFDVIIIDGAAMVNILKPIAITTFEDYALKVFIPYLDRQLQNVSRLDLVWDQYLDNSLKAQTRMKRGKGVRRRVAAHVCQPGNWQEFLRIDENKKELFTFLVGYVAQHSTEKERKKL